MCSFFVRSRQVLLLGSVAIAPTAAQEISGIAEQQLQRQQQREAAQRKLDGASPDVRLPGAQSSLLAGFPEHESPCFVIDSVKLDGEAAAGFQWALQAAQPALGPAWAVPASMSCSAGCRTR